MLESLTSNVFEYKKLSPEEQKQRGILGRLTGIIADFKNPTRNGRIYSESLWDHVFSDPIMKEKIQNRCVFGELGHPTDREEIDMEKIALCLAEQPKKGKDGKIYGVFDIMDTPNGRILKSLCDYGCNIGVSSRGSGDTFINSDGQEEVDESSYECQCWDAVLVPAVESARMNYVTESLNKKRYNKTLKESLEKAIEKSSDDDKRIIKESLDTLGITLTEDDLHDIFRKDVKDQYKAFNRKKDAYDKKADSVQQDLKDLGETDPERIDKFTKLVAGEEPVFKYEKGHNSLERQNYPFYVTVYEGISYYHPEEGGYYEAGLEPYYSEGYQTFEEAQQALQKYLEENSSTTVAFNPSNISSDDDNYSYSESEEEYKPFYDSKDRLIGAIASGKYIGEEEQVWVESNKQYLKKQSGYHPYESLSEDWAHDRYDELMKKGEDNWDIDDWDAYHYIMQVWFDHGYFDESLNEDTASIKEWQDKMQDLKDRLSHSIKSMLEKCPECVDEIYNVAVDCRNTFSDIVDNIRNNKEESFAVDNNEAMVEELQNTLKQKQELENQIAKLQEELSVCHAKESKLNEEIGRHKTTIIKLTENMTKVRALKSKIDVLNNEKVSLQEKLEKKSKELVKTKVDISKKQKSLDESYEAKKEKVNKLLETLRKDNQELKSTNKDLETKFNALNESVDDLKKDYELRTSDLTDKVEKSNKLVEKYNRIAKKAVDKYISEKATHIGVSTNEIVNRLPESYNFDDIDSICEELRSYKLNISRLPFSTLNEGKGLKLKATSEKDPIFLKENYENDVDEQLLKLAKLK